MANRTPPWSQVYLSAWEVTSAGAPGLPWASVRGVLLASRRNPFPHHPHLRGPLSSIHEAPHFGRKHEEEITKKRLFLVLRYAKEKWGKKKTFFLNLTVFITPAGSSFPWHWELGHGRCGWRAGDFAILSPVPNTRPKERHSRDTEFMIMLASCFSASKFPCSLWCF